jgi:hypothetical protein
MDSTLRSEEGGAKRRMTVQCTRKMVMIGSSRIAQVPNPHPPLRGTVSRWERDSWQVEVRHYWAAGVTR